MDRVNKFILLLIMVFSGFLLVYFLGNININKKIQTASVINSNDENYKDIFSDIDLSAKSVIIYDFTSNKKIYAYNENTPVPLASLTKIMTAMVALESYKTNSQIQIVKDALYPKDTVDFTDNDKFLLNDMVKLMLVSSSNNAALSLSFINGPNKKSVDHFVEKMNEKANNMGLDNTIFYNPSGLDFDVENNLPGAIGTARDVAQMFYDAQNEYPDIFSYTTQRAAMFPTLDGKIITVYNTDTSIGNLPGLLASKTGYTKLAGGNLAIMFSTEGHKVGIVVLGSGKEERFSDVELLAQKTTDYIKLKYK